MKSLLPVLSHILGTTGNMKVRARRPISETFKAGDRPVLSNHQIFHDFSTVLLAV